MPEQAAQANPEMFKRTRATTLAAIRALETADEYVISDATLNNLHSWLQSVVIEMQNSHGNPQAAGSYLNNSIASIEAISQNLHQIPQIPPSDALSDLVQDAQRRADQLATYEGEAKGRARSIMDQMQVELDKIRESSEEAMRAAKQRNEQAQELFAQLGAKGSSSDYLETARNEEHSADIWRRVTIGLGVTLAVVSVAFTWMHRGTDLSLGAILGKALVVIPLILLTGYTGKQAAEHRTQQRRARTLGLQLASLGVFLADLTPDARRDIKSHLSRMVFAVDSTAHISEGYPSSGDLLKVVTELLDKIPSAK